MTQELGVVLQADLLTALDSVYNKLQGLNFLIEDIDLKLLIW